MKKSFFLLSIIMLSMLAITSCSKNSKMADLLERIPENVDMVAVGDFKTMIESAGGSIADGKIKFPKYIDDLDSDFEEFSSFVKDYGIDPDACALTLNYKNSYPIIVFSLADKEKFISAIEDNKFRDKSSDNDVLIYVNKGEYTSDWIAVKDNYAYWIEGVWEDSDFDPNKSLKRMIEDAAESPYSKTSYCDYITSGNAAGASFKIPRELRRELKESGIPSSVADMYEGVICMKGNLDNDVATVDVKWYGEDGNVKSAKDFENTIDFKSKINKNALQYLGKDEFMVMAMSLKGMDWDKYIETVVESMGMSRSERQQFSALKDYLNKIDGTVAIGFGLKNGMESIINMNYNNDVMNQFDLTMVVETKDGKAKGLINDLKDLMGQYEIPFESSSNGFTIEIPGEKGVIYAQADDNTIVLSNHSISKSNNNVAVKAFNFQDYFFAFAVAMNKTNPLMSDFDIKNDILFTMATNTDDLEMSAMLEIKGGKSEGIIAKATQIIIDIASQERKFESKWNEAERKAYGYNYYDDAYDMCDSVVVAEDYYEVGVDEAIAD